MRHARSKGFESQRRCALLRSTHSNIATNPSSEAKSLAKPPHFACRSILCRRSGRTLAAKASSTPHTSHCCAATTPHQWRKKYHNFTLPVLTLPLYSDLADRSNWILSQIPICSDESHTLFGQPFSSRGKPKLRFSTKLVRSPPLPFERHGIWRKTRREKSGVAHGDRASDRASGMLVHG